VRINCNFNTPLKLDCVGPQRPTCHETKEILHAQEVWSEYRLVTHVHEHVSYKSCQIEHAHELDDNLSRCVLCAHEK
jgi:hypothetical protein